MSGRLIDKGLIRKLIKDETRPSTNEFSDGWNNALLMVLQSTDSGRLDAQSPTSGQEDGLPEWLLDIGHKLRTQDNRITAEPLFCVFQKRRIYGLDPAYGDDNWVWLQMDEGCEVDASEVELDEFGQPVNDIFQKVYYMDIDVFVTAHLTEADALHHIKINGHNLKKPFTYVTSQFRCPEYIQLRNWLMSLPPSPTSTGERE